MRAYSIAVALAWASGLAAVSAAEPQEHRLFELRIYHAAPGKLDDLHARFRDHTVNLFEKHGMTNVGYWVPVENEENLLIYLLAYPNREAREEAWKDFMADPEWRKAFAESTRDGRLVTRVESTFLTPTDYSPPVRSQVAEPPRLFELRTYTAAPEKLSALNARFRDHTLMLFARHGMHHVGYWTPAPSEQGTENTLVYILAHPTRKSRDAAFEKFRADPDWIEAKRKSEADGRLALKVDSVLMIPTDYSTLK